MLHSCRVPSTSTLSRRSPGTPACSQPPDYTPSPQGRHSPTHTPPHTCASFRGHSYCQLSPFQAHGFQSCTRSQSYLLPLSLPSRVGLKAEQKPSVPSSPPPSSPLPSGVQPLCPPAAAEPEQQSRQSGKDIGAQAAKGAGRRTGVAV